MRRKIDATLKAKVALEVIYPKLRKYPYLLRDLEISHADHVWAADISAPRRS